MKFAGPLNSIEEARGVEQIAFLTQLRTRLRNPRKRGESMPPIKLIGAWESAPEADGEND